MSFWKYYLDELKKLEKKGAKIYSIGYSELNRPILCVQVGNGEKKLLINYSIQATDYITFCLPLLHIKHLLKPPSNNTVLFVPILNPDGICLNLNGLNSIDCLNDDLSYSENMFPFCYKKPKKSTIFLSKIKLKLLKLNNNSKDFSLWQSNINGVNLTTDFCDYDEIKKIEKESQAILNFIKQIKPNMIINYQSKGEIICFNYKKHNKNFKKDNKIAKTISQLTKYKIRRNKKCYNWDTKNFHIPQITIKVGRENLNYPISKKHLLYIAMQNKKVITKSLALLDEFKI